MMGDVIPNLVVLTLLVVMNGFSVFTIDNSTILEAQNTANLSNNVSTGPGKPISSIDNTHSNVSMIDVGVHGSWMNKFGINDSNFGMYQRAFYVVMGVTALVVIYLVIKMIIMKRRKKKARKYGVLDESTLEMAQSDDEDDLFDQSQRRLIS